MERMHVRIVLVLVSAAILACSGCAGNKAKSTTPAAAQQTAPPKVASVFSDNMVLQRNLRVPVWGWARAGEKVTVQFADQKKTARADDSGKWMVRLNRMKAGGPYEMTVSSPGGSVTFKDVLVGEVWIASGQSNMQWRLKDTENADAEIAASSNPNIRLYYVPRKPAENPVQNVDAKWTPCTPETAGEFSAVAYYFGKNLQQDLNVPIGLIHTSWGGTAIELWTSKEVLQKQDNEHYAQMVKSYDDAKRQLSEGNRAYQQAMEKWKKEAEQARAEGRPVPQQPRRPGLPAAKPAELYNGMIAPLIPYGIAGAIWYQGESNAGNAIKYREQQPAMIKNWRDAWDQGDFPFLFVQLANYMAREAQPSDPDWAYLREAQTLTLEKSPRTGMAVIIDIGDAKDIHPRNKADVGKRLALAAEAIAYGRKIEYSGPMYDSMKIEENQIRVKFKHIGSGLMARGGTLKGFAIASGDRKFVWADARIEGDSVVVSSPQVKSPVAVRYAWANNPEATLYNKEGLPASPFRTDDWDRPNLAR